MDLNTTIVSLLEVVNYLRDALKRHGISETYNNKYYLMAIINEIFCIGNSVVEHKKELSTKILINDGIPETEAIRISVTIYRMLIDLIVNVYPHITFGDRSKYMLELYGNYDLMITKLSN